MSKLSQTLVKEITGIRSNAHPNHDRIRIEHPLCEYDRQDVYLLQEEIKAGEKTLGGVCIQAPGQLERWDIIAFTRVFTRSDSDRDIYALELRRVGSIGHSAPGAKP